MWFSTFQLVSAVFGVDHNFCCIMLSVDVGLHSFYTETSPRYFDIYYWTALAPIVHWLPGKRCLRGRKVAWPLKLWSNLFYSLFQSVLEGLAAKGHKMNQLAVTDRGSIVQIIEGFKGKLSAYCDVRKGGCPDGY
jgi:hypothetical protein